MTGNGTMQGFGGKNTQVVCYAPNKITFNGIWQGGDPFDYSLPLFILQLAMIVFSTRVFVFLLKPFRQPRVIAEIFGGLIFGPSGLGRYEAFTKKVFPTQSIMILETMANIGLLYFLFLVGVEMDLSIIRRTGKKSIAVALAGMVLPFLIAAAAYSKIVPPHVHQKGHEERVDKATFIIFFGVAISVTAFPVLARILAELKLLGTELGRIAMSSAIVNDMLAWILLALGIAFAQSRYILEFEPTANVPQNPHLSVSWIMILSTIFVSFCIFVLRPGIGWIIRRMPEGESVSDFHICLILSGVLLCGFITDSIGTHSIFGAFLFGLVIPNGPFGSNIIEKLEDFVSGLLLPLFFAISGLRTNIRSMTYSAKWIWTLLVLVLCSLAKIGATFFTALFYGIPTRDGVALGLLMNTKGLIEMIVLNVGRDQEVLSDEIFALMVIIAVLTTAIIIPMVTAVYRPGRRFIPYKRRTIQKSKPDAELRLLACIHNARSVPTIISLLDLSHPSKKSPIYVYALQLVELTGRASAMLIVNTRKSGHPALNKTQAQGDQIVTAFETYEQHATFVTVQPLTAISPYSTMHEDICNLAKHKRVSLIVVPFHKQQTIDGGMESPNPAFRTVNQNVLANAPCSVGILVDRGLGASTRATNSHAVHSIIVLFFGGPDDREALAYASRMSGSPCVGLTVFRFIPGDEARESIIPHEESSTDNGSLSVVTDKDKDRQTDEDFICDFRLKTSNNESVIYMEKVTNNGEETVSAIRSIDNIYDLYIVGRGEGMVSPLTAGLTDWSECPELGAIGDLLASSDFGLAVSVLVVQQYVGMGLQGDGVGTPDSPAAQQPDQPLIDQHLSKALSYAFGKHQNLPN
ncbi:hypothetical protein MKW94_013949 [Papaver nudicaule]|uniref:Cation/H+ exchanger domain-containing protein n=1 Tax=Papaver nudicaule TaxID=74823 RepID=A0AA41VZL5_PAPNU|nr:hypothetical protein [Papaver nudicaule]